MFSTLQPGERGQARWLPCQPCCIRLGTKLGRGKREGERSEEKKSDAPEVIHTQLRHAAVTVGGGTRRESDPVFAEVVAGGVVWLL